MENGHLMLGDAAGEAAGENLTVGDVAGVAEGGGNKDGASNCGEASGL